MSYPLFKLYYLKIDSDDNGRIKLNQYPSLTELEQLADRFSIVVGDTRFFYVCF